MQNKQVKTLAVSWALILGASLTACSGANAANHDECEPLFSSGALVKNVTVLGKFGEEPQISVPEGFTVGGPTRLLIDSAEDRAPANNNPSVMTVNYRIVSSEGNTVIESSESFTAGKGFDFLPVSMAPAQGAFLDGVACSSPGDRVLIGFDADEAASIAGAFGAPDGTNFVALVDVHEVSNVVNTNRVRNLPSGFPGVVTNSDGLPGVVIAPGKAPSVLKEAVRIAGEGRIVEDGDGVVANVLQVSWTGQIVENSWSAQGPRYLGTASDPVSAVRPLLSGSNVGSQMVYLVPNATGSADIFVVDVLAAG